MAYGIVRGVAAGYAAVLLSACGSGGGSDATPGGQKVARPNILMVIMDDVGIDQMASFGYGGATPPAMPNMDAVAQAGIRFRNTWAMPECSPSRAAMFVGRYPTRTNIYQAIGANDLANSHVSPFEMTAPRLLKQAGYDSAMFGKFHLGGPENNEAGSGAPLALGWDYFYGWIGGVPGSIDGTAGGIAPEKTYSCGFVPGPVGGGANQGACYYADNTCQPMQRASLDDDVPGKQCLDSGGIFAPAQMCGATPPAGLNFNRENAYYVSPLVIIENGKVEEVPLDDPRARGYRTRIEADAAIRWIKSRQGSERPWMATVSFSAAHTPVQQPPVGLVKANGAVLDSLNCNGPLQGREIQNRMIEAMDTEFGRILVETGLARRKDDGSLAYEPAATNTMIVIVGDNGTFGFAVKQPFSPQRAKGSAYQTGVWVPLIVAGAQVEKPDREVEHMVNVVDLYQLFGEAAGIDPHAVVPRTLDSTPMLPYLTNPDQASARSVNFSISGINVQADGKRNGPCELNGACTQIPMSQGICEDNQGVWWGKGYTDASVVDNGGVGYQSCCQVNQALHLANRDQMNIFPEISVALRDDRLKIVRNTTQSYDAANNVCGVAVTNALYEVNQAAPQPLLDDPDRNLLLAPLTTSVQQRYQELTEKLEAILAADPACPGDGNRDGVVNAQDLEHWQRIAQNWGLSSVYDALIDGVADGLTNHADGMVVQQNLGRTCPTTYAVY